MNARFLGLFLLFPLFGACNSTDEAAPPTGVPVRIKQDHAHSRYCGHFLYGAKWYFAGVQHRHGVNCGHEFAEGFWIQEES